MRTASCFYYVYLLSMKRSTLFIAFMLIAGIAARCQDLVEAANRFIGLLDSAQKLKALYPFDSEERYGFHYFPIDNRGGIPMDELDDAQQKAAFGLLRTCLSDQAAEKVTEIMKLETILKQLENRKPDDHFRDPGKYYFAIFGIPANNTTWGWRFEGHHASFNFSAQDKKLISGTPGFLGANPAVVQQGPQKGKQILKDETNMGFALLHSLSPEELKKTIINTDAPGDIVTSTKRKAMIENPQGLKYSEMSPVQQEKLLQLIKLYVHRYTKSFADEMLREIQGAGLENIRFAWAGFTEPGIGKPHYYRVQGPTFIIEYDNTQNNANHVHTVLRDLKHDFGGDALLEHYKTSHHDAK